MGKKSKRRGRNRGGGGRRPQRGKEPAPPAVAPAAVNGSSPNQHRTVAEAGIHRTGQVTAGATAEHDTSATEAAASALGAMTLAGATEHGSTPNQQRGVHDHQVATEADMPDRGGMILATFLFRIHYRTQDGSEESFDYTVRRSLDRQFFDRCRTDLKFAARVYISGLAANTSSILSQLQQSLFCYRCPRRFENFNAEYISVPTLGDDGTARFSALVFPCCASKTCKFRIFKELNLFVQEEVGARPIKSFYRCQFCNKYEEESGSFQQCARCNVTSYCCEEHQINDWPAHKKVCKPPESCLYCGISATPSEDFKFCGGCKKAFYCCLEHQHQHWRAGHREECESRGRQQRP